MANNEKGEVSIQIGNDTYTLALTLDAMVALEEMFSTNDKPMFFTDIAALAERGSTKHTRGLMWALFQEHHPEVGLADVSKLVAKAGGIMALSESLEKLMERSTPDKRDVGALGLKNPPKAQAGKARTNGTGATSTSAPGAQA